MRWPEFHFRWQWQVEATPEQLWPLFADTNRFNHDSGLNTTTPLHPPKANAYRTMRMMMYGMALNFEEQPFEWARPHRFAVRRRYFSGPVGDFRVEAELHPQPQGGTHIVYQVWATPRNLLGLLAIPVQVGVLARHNFGVTVRRYDQVARARQPVLDLPATVTFAPGGRARLAERCAVLKTRLPDHPELADRLADLLSREDNARAARLRPYVWADRWGAPRPATLTAFLQATRLGLLDLRWDLLCPLCRGAQESAAHLSDLAPSRAVHCPTCQIDFNADFERSVELTFRPNPAIRAVSEAQYCMAGPHSTPHIVAQFLLAPHTQRAVTLTLEAGDYRVRALNLPGAQMFRASADGPASARFALQGDGWHLSTPVVGTTLALTLDNPTAAEHLFIVERTAWSDQAVIAADVFALQTFRDLFSSEALRPGEQVSVGSLTVLFTDLRSSTALYREIGDAPAFGLVMNHFDVLRRVIEAEEGAIVKTIGDAVMAVFRQPLHAVRAMCRAQTLLAVPGEWGRTLSLKAGIHHGPCIAVTLNERLDYFGTTVNVAARLVEQSTGGDVVISETVFADPAVRAWLDNPPTPLAVRADTVLLKGFDAPRPIYRLGG